MGVMNLLEDAHDPGKPADTHRGTTIWHLTVTSVEVSAARGSGYNEWPQRCFTDVTSVRYKDVLYRFAACHVWSPLDTSAGTFCTFLFPFYSSHGKKKIERTQNKNLCAVVRCGIVCKVLRGSFCWRRRTRNSLLRDLSGAGRLKWGCWLYPTCLVGGHGYWRRFSVSE